MFYTFFTFRVFECFFSGSKFLLRSILLLYLFLLFVNTAVFIFKIIVSVAVCLPLIILKVVKLHDCSTKLLLPFFAFHRNILRQRLSVFRSPIY